MSLDRRLTDLTALLHRIAVQYRACAFASSFGAEDMVLHDVIAKHALPITVGFWFATILNRILANIQSANHAANRLVGKISGAVGVYNAQVGLGIAARSGDRTFEARVLDKLGLKAHERIAGFVHIGTPARPSEERNRPALDEIVTRFPS